MAQFEEGGRLYHSLSDYSRYQNYIAAHPDNITIMWLHSDGRYMFCIFSGMREEKYIKPFTMLFYSDSVKPGGYCSKRRMFDGLLEVLKNCRRNFMQDYPEEKLRKVARERQRPFLFLEHIHRLVKSAKKARHGVMTDASISTKYWTSKYPRWIDVAPPISASPKELWDESKTHRYYLRCA